MNPVVGKAISALARACLATVRWLALGALMGFVAGAVGSWQFVFRGPNVFPRLVLSTAYATGVGAVWSVAVALLMRKTEQALLASLVVLVGTALITENALALGLGVLGVSSMQDDGPLRVGDIVQICGVFSVLMVAFPRGNLQRIDGKAACVALALALSATALLRYLGYASREFFEDGCLDNGAAGCADYPPGSLGPIGFLCVLIASLVGFTGAIVVCSRFSPERRGELAPGGVLPRFSGRRHGVPSIDNNRANFADLRRTFERAELVPFIGAGMSIPCGLGSWTSFLIEQARLNGLEREIRETLDRSDYEGAAERLEQALGSDQFNHQIRQAFGAALKLSGPVLLLPSIVKTAVITTNFDRVIESVFVTARRRYVPLWGTKVAAFDRAALTEDVYILKIHGDCVDPSDRVLTRAEYDASYGADAVSGPAAVRLINVFEKKSVLFLGCSLGQDRVMKALHSVAGRTKATLHFAICEAPATSAARRERSRWLHERNIAPIYYPAGEHDWVESILRELIQERPLRAGGAKAPSQARSGDEDEGRRSQSGVHFGS